MFNDTLTMLLDGIDLTKDSAKLYRLLTDKYVADEILNAIDKYKQYEVAKALNITQAKLSNIATLLKEIYSYDTNMYYMEYENSKGNYAILSIGYSKLNAPQVDIDGNDLFKTNCTRICMWRFKRSIVEQYFVELTGKSEAIGAYNNSCSVVIDKLPELVIDMLDKQERFYSKAK